MDKFYFLKLTYQMISTIICYEIDYSLEQKFI